MASQRLSLVRCRHCLRLSRGFSQTTWRATLLSPKEDADKEPRPAGEAIEAPRSYGKRFEGEFTPKPLPRPIGMPLPPRAGENTGVDSRTLRQRRDDLADYDKHLARRRELTAQMARPYFRDWGNLRFHEGKSFIAPPRLFRSSVSLFFPNLRGRTLTKNGNPDADTTPLLLGRASVVSLFSGRWAQYQTDSFANADAVRRALDEAGGPAQLVRINYEDNAGKAWLVRLFAGSLRRSMPSAEWSRYLLVRRGITEHMRESMGLLNSKVGYTYLVDSHCRIRWAASGSALPEETESLAKGLTKLVEEVKGGNAKKEENRR